MGWSIPYNMPHRTQAIDELTKTWRSDSVTLSTLRARLLPGMTVPEDAKSEDYRFECECLKRCYRGGMRSGTLWVVHESRYFRKADNVLVSAEKWIGCNLLKYYSEGRGVGNWGWKSMSESSGPGVTSCPLSYLEMVPVPHYENGTICQYAVTWREQVRAAAKVYKPALLERVSLRGCKVAWVQIVSLRPLKGRDGTGYLWKIPRKLVEGKYSEETVANTGPS